MGWWYHIDDNGMSDFSRPMTEPEMVALYREAADDDPTYSPACTSAFTRSSRLNSSSSRTH